MSVEELIKKLQDFPKDSLVVVGECDLFGYFSVGEATDVYQVDDDLKKYVRIC